MQLEQNNSITFELPINIQPTINNDGYVITDANNVQMFFSNSDSKNGTPLSLEYDGFSAPIKIN